MAPAVPRSAAATRVFARPAADMAGTRMSASAGVAGVPATDALGREWPGRALPHVSTECPVGNKATSVALSGRAVQVSGGPGKEVWGARVAGGACTSMSTHEATAPTTSGEGLGRARHGPRGARGVSCALLTRNGDSRTRWLGPADDAVAWPAPLATALRRMRRAVGTVENWAGLRLPLQSNVRGAVGRAA
jgi:hypothetical protein